MPEAVGEAGADHGAVGAVRGDGEDVAVDTHHGKYLGGRGGGDGTHVRTTCYAI